LLVCNSERSQDVKKLLEKLKEEGKHLYLWVEVRPNQFLIKSNK
jgi:predicted amino acid-binding ACT domain protein